LLLVLSNVLLLGILSAVNSIPAQITITGFASIFVAATILVVAVRFISNSSIISVRRVFGVYFIASLVWLIIYLSGVAYSLLSHNLTPSVNGLLLGGFFAIALELLVINGVFITSTSWSLFLSLMHPLTILLLIIPSINIEAHSIPVISGCITVILVLSFLLSIKRLRTAQHEIPSLRLLQAFLKTWVSKNPQELEQYFTTYSAPEETTTRVLKFTASSREMILVLPDIHPGPFYPVGSYNLSEVIYEKLRNDHSTPFVLHGAGGHERNLPSNYYTNQYGEELRRFTESMQVTPGAYEVKGPLLTKVGQNTVTCTVFDHEVLLTVSTAPYNSDDLDLQIVSDVRAASENQGFRVSVVDAHNCIGAGEAPDMKVTTKDWSELFHNLESQKEHKLEIGYAHSSEVEFTRNADISDGGIGTLIFRDDESKKVLVIADANNAVTGLREEIARELKNKGFMLMELCTSDTHNLAARNLVKRGYFALGEATPVSSITKLVSKLVDIADTRIEACSFAIASFPMRIPLIGRESLHDFVTMTNKAISFSKAFAKWAAPTMFALIVITILL
jgi:putative membrane protein